MSKKLIISKLKFNQANCLVTAIFDGVADRIIDININSENKENILGNIYIGKVQKISKHLNAAFIDIKPNFACYYSLNKNKSAYITSAIKRSELKAGDELLVQVSTEALKTKVPTVTSQLNVPGRYVVLTVGKNTLGISGKISEEARKELKILLTPHLRKDCGIVVRTNAVNATDEAILTELAELYSRLDNIYHLGDTRTCYSLIDTAIPEYIQNLRRIKNTDLAEIITDDRTVFTEIQGYLHDFQVGDIHKLRYYEDDLLSLSKLYSVESTLETASREKVWLKSGGFITIQQTEAFVVVDVNSGKYQGQKNTELFFHKINLEAAKEIAVQLRLRNLSGIILIDFINIKKRDSQIELLETLQKYLHQDSTKAVVVDITPLHIVEVTRQKSRKSLSEQVAEI